MNSVQLIGNLGGDPDAKYFESGKVKVSMTLYMNEKYKQGEELKESVNRIPLEAWGKTAEFAANYLRKGNRIAVSGSLKENTWTDNGQNRSRLVVQVQSIENLTPKRDGSATPTNAEEPDF